MSNPAQKWAKHSDVRRYINDIENEYLVRIDIGFKWLSGDYADKRARLTYWATTLLGSDVPRGTYEVVGVLNNSIKNGKVDAQHLFYLTQLAHILQIARVFGTYTLDDAFNPPSEGQ